VRLKSVRDSSLLELNARAGAFVAACGYERRSVALSSLITGAPEGRNALCFSEWPDALGRKDNERQLLERGFKLHGVGGNESKRVESLVADIATTTILAGAAVGFDISSMTRAWHGAIIRQFRTMEFDTECETFFAYAPAQFRRPPLRSLPNEFVAPVDGFASLSTPDLPVAVVIGLGYERERALGLRQLLDPEKTILMIPNCGDKDEYYPEVLRSNKDILRRTHQEWVFEYCISEPAATFATLISIVAGLRESYRVVLASLGPKVFGLLSFLLATRFADVSVWRVSSGIHAQPREAHADLDQLVVIDAIWEPSSRTTGSR
jgi:hypothetical protein